MHYVPVKMCQYIIFCFVFMFSLLFIKLYIKRFLRIKIDLRSKFSHIEIKIVVFQKDLRIKQHRLYYQKYYNILICCTLQSFHRFCTLILLNLPHHYWMYAIQYAIQSITTNYKEKNLSKLLTLIVWDMRCIHVFKFVDWTSIV